MPLSSTGTIKIRREGSVLTATVYDSYGDIVASASAEGVSLLMNHIRLAYMVQTNYDSKVWVNDLDLDGREVSPDALRGYELQGEVYVDPVALKFGDGWLGFVKNTPIKPLTVNSFDETRTAAEWISYMIKHYLLNKIVPKFELNWQMLDSSESREVWCLSDIGIAMLQYPNKIDSLQNHFKATIPSLNLLPLQPNLVFQPELIFYNSDDYQLYELDSNGAIKYWAINTYEDNGLNYPYPICDQSDYANELMLGSTLFNTDFNESDWSYDYQWLSEDYGYYDYTNSGLVNDTALGTWALRLNKYNFLTDPYFENMDVIWNDTSTHYLFTNHPNAILREEVFGYDAECGYPSPSIFLFNPNNTISWQGSLGTKLNISDLYDFSTEGYVLEFDYWASHANQTYGPVLFNVTMIAPKSLSRITNPQNYTDLCENFTRFDGQASYLYYASFTENEPFQHFAYDGFSDTLKEYAELANPDWLFNIFFNIEVHFDSGKGNQTVYIDNIRLSPVSYYLPGTVEDSGGYYNETATVSSTGTWRWQLHDGAQISRLPREGQFQFWDSVGDSSAELSVDSEDLVTNGASKFFFEVNLAPVNNFGQYDAFGLVTALGSNYYAKAQWETGSKLKFGISTTYTPTISNWVTGHTFELDFAWQPEEYHRLLIIGDFDNEWVAFGVDGKIYYNETDSSYISRTTVGTTYLGVDNKPLCINKKITVDSFRTGAFDQLNYSLARTQGPGEGYGIYLDWDLDQSAGTHFFPSEEAKVINYPFVFLKGVSSFDSFAEGGDYEFAIKVHDQTYNRDIWLHYCWSNDAVLIDGHLDQEVIITPSNTTHFYIHRAEALWSVGQDISIDLLAGLNGLVKESLLVIDRENTMHSLDVRLRLENGTTLQMTGLTISGFASWKEIGLGTDATFNSQTFLGNLVGKTEAVILANTYLFSEKRQVVKLQVTCDQEWSVLLDGSPVNQSIYFDGESPRIFEVILNSGINHLSVIAPNTASGSSFKIQALLLETNETEPATGVYVTTNSTNPTSFPLARGAFGGGSITLFAFNDQEVTHKDDLKDLLANLLIHESERLFITTRAKKQNFLHSVENSWITARYDLAYDWMNEDDPFKDIIDEKVMTTAENWLRAVDNHLYEVLCLARCPEGENLDDTELVQLYDELKEMFIDARMTGNSTGFYDGQTLYWEKPGNEKTVFFPDLDKDYCFHVYENYDRSSDELFWNYHFFGVVQGHLQIDEGNKLSVVLKLRSLEYRRDGESQLGEPAWNPPHTPVENWGTVKVYNASRVFVEDPVQGHEGTTYLQQGQWVSLLDFFNATAYLIKDLADYTLTPVRDGEPADTVNPTFLDFLDSWFFKKFTEKYDFWRIDLSQHLSNYIENLKQKMFIIGYNSALNYLLEKDEAYTATYEEEQESFIPNFSELVERAKELLSSSAESVDSIDVGVTRGNHTLIPSSNIALLTLNVFSRLLSRIKGSMSNDYDNWSPRLHFGRNYPVPYGQVESGVPIKKCYSCFEILSNFVPFCNMGHATDSLKFLLADAIAIFLNDKHLPNHGAISRLFLMGQYQRVFIPVAKEEGSQKAKLGVYEINPESEDTRTTVKNSAIQFGMTKMIIVRTIISREFGIRLIPQEQWLIDQEQFEGCMYRAYDDSQSEMYGTLPEITSDRILSRDTIQINGHSRTVDYFQMEAWAENKQSMPVNVIVGRYYDDTPGVERNRYFIANVISGLDYGHPATSEWNKDDWNRQRDEITGKLRLNVKRLKDTSTTVTYTSSIPNDPQTIAVDSLADISSDHPFYNLLTDCSTAQQRLDRLTNSKENEKNPGLGLIPLVMGGTDPNNGMKKVVIWVNADSVTFDCHPRYSVSLGPRARVILYRTANDEIGASLEALKGEGSTNDAVSDSSFNSIEGIYSNIVKDGKLLYDHGEFVISRTLTAEGFKNQWKIMLESALELAKRNNNGDRHTTTDPSYQFMSFLIIPMLLNEFNRLNEEKPNEYFFESSDTIKTEVLTEMVNNCMRAINERAIELGGKEFIFEKDKSGILKLKSKLPKHIKLFVKYFDEFWKMSGWDEFYEVKDQKGKTQSELLLTLAHGLLTNNARAAARARTKMMNTDTGNVPTIGGVQYSLQMCFDSDWSFLTEDGEAIEIREVSAMDPYMCRVALIHQALGCQGIHWKKDFYNGKYAPLIGAAKLFRYIFQRLDDAKSPSVIHSLLDSKGEPTFSYGKNQLQFEPIPTWATDTSGDFLNVRPVDLMTANAMKDVLDSLFMIITAAENVERTEYIPLNDLIKKLGIYNILDRIINDQEWIQGFYVKKKYAGAKTPGPNWMNTETTTSENFAHRFAQAVLEFDKEFYESHISGLSVAELKQLIEQFLLGGTGVFYEHNNKITQSKAESIARKFFEYLSYGIMVEPLQSGSSYCLSDFLFDCVVFYDYDENNDKYTFWKWLPYQKVRFSQEKQKFVPVLDKYGRPVWFVRKVFITKETLLAGGLIDLDNLDSQTDSSKKHMIHDEANSNYDERIYLPTYTSDNTKKLPIILVHGTKVIEKQLSEKYNLREVLALAEELAPNDPQVLGALAAIMRSAGEENDDYKNIHPYTNLINLRQEASKIRNNIRDIFYLETKNIEDFSLNGWLSNKPVPYFGSKLDHALTRVKVWASVYRRDSIPLNVIGRLLKGGIKNDFKGIVKLIKPLITASLCLMCGFMLIEDTLFGTPDETYYSSRQNARAVLRSHLESIIWHDVQYFYRMTGSRNPLGVSPLGPEGHHDDIKKFHLFLGLSLLSGAMFGVNTFSSIPRQFGAQLLWGPLIEFTVQIAYTNTFVKNIRSMSGNGTAVGCRGKVVERYACDNKTQTALSEGEIIANNKTRHWDAFISAIWTWATDYFEFDLGRVNGEIWEIINGYATGQMLARIDAGMRPIHNGRKAVFVEDPLSVIQCLNGISDLENLPIVGNLCQIENVTQFVSSPGFKAFYQSLLFGAGSLISVFTEIADQGFNVILTGGASGVASSMVAGYFVQQFYQAVHTSEAEATWKSKWHNYITSSIDRKGDAGYSSSSWFYRYTSFYDFMNCLFPDKFKALPYEIAFLSSSLGTLLIILGSVAGWSWVPFLIPVVVVFAAYCFIGWMWTWLKIKGWIPEPSTLGDPPDN